MSQHADARRETREEHEAEEKRKKAQPEPHPQPPPSREVRRERFEEPLDEQHERPLPDGSWSQALAWCRGI
jgi:hypothetical protein